MKKGTENRGKTQEFNLGIFGQGYTSAFPQQDGRFHLRKRSAPRSRINPDESYDSSFIHAGALVHALE
ncbi:unnamed protein product [Lasius platythorax]|uniref:Uncharacterized protein n=1 Tax=Lasius platythorax TaxID=488582 RepID=A0AAV2N1R9_9HYME